MVNKLFKTRVSNNFIQSIMSPENPLVSIIVVTYNSSQYVIETLESAKMQTYQNIELIVSDDCSTDHTVEICRQWINANSERFVRTEIITVSKNTGVPSNCNRGLYKANGIWIKYIAGDDILNKDCIQKFMHIAMDDNQEHSFLVCNKSIFENKSTKILSEEISNIIEQTYKKQLIKYACIRPTIAPFMFIKKNTILELNGFDESYHLLEDSPFYFKALKSNYFFLLVDEDLVYYRLSDSSISNSNFQSQVFTNELRKFTNYNIIPYLLSNGLLINGLISYIESNFENKSVILYFLKVLKKLAKIERKILYSV